MHSNFDTRDPRGQTRAPSGVRSSHPNSHRCLGKFSIRRKYFNRAKFTVLNVLKTKYSKLKDMHFILIYSSLFIFFTHCCYHFLSKFKLILKAKNHEVLSEVFSSLCHCKPFTLIQKHTESPRQPGLLASVTFSSLFIKPCIHASVDIKYIP